MTDIKNNAPKMQAIETAYKGYRFRSRLEARWAIFFDVLRVPWEYEPEGYRLPDGRGYLPDFLVGSPEYFQVFAEVKPCGGDFEKARAFAAISDRNVILLEGPPDFRSYDLVDYTGGSIMRATFTGEGGKYSVFYHADECRHPPEFEPKRAIIDYFGEAGHGIHAGYALAVLESRAARFGT